MPTIITPPKTCADTVHYSTTINSIVTAHCAISGCHVSGGVPGALDFTQVANVQAQDSAIYSRTTLLSTQIGFMPSTGSPLTSDEIQSFYCWWKQGAPL